MQRVTIQEARAILLACAIPPDSDFHTLRPVQVDAILACATLRGYRKPKDANGSTARYFHAYVQRTAKKEARHD